METKKIEEIIDKPDTISSLSNCEILDILLKAEKIFEKENNLIKITKKTGQIIFVGDTHGDFEITKKIIREYLKNDNIVIFLGDYVDRGAQSQENVNYLLINKLINPNLILLMGNHEAFSIFPFPVTQYDFWEIIKSNSKLFNQYSKTFSKLPLAVSIENTIIALHGGLPDISDITYINKIKNGDAHWDSIIRMDFVSAKGEYLGMDSRTERHKYGEDYFNRIMNTVGKKILVRGHDYNVKGYIYNNRCLTLFTSNFYEYVGNIEGKMIGIVDLSKPIKSSKDIEIVFI